MVRLIWWIRRDLRLEDNTVLAAALTNAAEVIPVFVLDDKLLASPRVQGARIAWMLDGLHALDTNLRHYGSSLVIRRGDPASELLAVCQESQVEGVYFNRDYSPYAVRRDQAVIQALSSAGFRVKTFKDAVIHETGEIASAQGKPYEVYTPFRKAWLALPKPDIFAQNLRPDCFIRSSLVASLSIPSAADLNSTPVKSPIVLAGEGNAKRRLAAFVGGPIFDYGKQCNRPDLDGSAILSPYLRWGMISPRQCYWDAMQSSGAAPDEAGRLSVDAWIGELVWREFFYQLLTNHPSSVKHNLRSIYDGLVWQNRQDWLDAWVEGRTGYPIVDAAMRQMNATGWMHNRARLIVASFLCKDLLIDWRQGEVVFMQRLIDGDVANNVGNWQWSAGTGADAAPYFRIFNPTTQGERFDPEGDYIRRWIPELSNVPKALIHTPEKMTADQQKKAGCVLGYDYPMPIVDHAVQRKRALAIYASAKAESAIQTDLDNSAE